MLHQISFLNTHEAFDLNKLMGYDALVIDAKDIPFTRATIKEIRSHTQSEIALKPVFLLNPKETEDPLIRNLNDGIIFSPEKLHEIASKIDQLFLRTTHLSAVLPASFNEQILKRSIDYMYTRGIETLFPYLDHLSAIGYTWPEISVHFESFEEPKVMEILDFAQKEGFLLVDFIDRIHVCNGCNSGFIHLHEICPTCSSKNIETEDLIHHFPCAYVGPLNDFKKTNTDALICPKCNKKLRHIGIDHDKPSVICHCNMCNKKFQDAFIVAKCLHCKKQMEIEYLTPKNIYNYTLTKKGKYIATSGASFFKEIETVIVGTSSFEFYKEFLLNQFDRIKNHVKINSIAVLIILTNMDDIYLKVGKELQEQILTSIIQVIRANVRSCDLIAIENPFCIHICLTDYKNLEIDALLKKIVSRLTTLLNDNFEVSNSEIICKQKNMTHYTSLEKILSELNEYK